MNNPIRSWLKRIRERREQWWESQDSQAKGMEDFLSGKLGPLGYSSPSQIASNEEIEASNGH